MASAIKRARTAKLGLCPATMLRANCEICLAAYTKAQPISSQSKDSKFFFEDFNSDIISDDTLKDLMSEIKELPPDILGDIDFEEKYTNSDQEQHDKETTDRLIEAALEEIKSQETKSSGGHPGHPWTSDSFEDNFSKTGSQPTTSMNMMQWQSMQCQFTSRQIPSEQFLPNSMQRMQNKGVTSLNGRNSVNIQTSRPSIANNFEAQQQMMAHRTAQQHCSSQSQFSQTHMTLITWPSVPDYRARMLAKQQQSMMANTRDAAIRPGMYMSNFDSAQAQQWSA